MAWYSLYRWFIQFRRTPYTNYILWYRQFLYDNWFESLSTEQKMEELEYQRRLEERRKHDTDIAFAKLRMLTTYLAARCGRF